MDTRELVFAKYRERTENIKIHDDLMDRYYGANFRHFNGWNAIREPFCFLQWDGPDCTLAWIQYAGGTLYALARVNAVAKDKFSKFTGRLTALSKLDKEVKRLEAIKKATGVEPTENPNSVRRYGDYYFSREMLTKNSADIMSFFVANEIMRTITETRLGRK